MLKEEAKERERKGKKLWAGFHVQGEANAKKSSRRREKKQENLIRFSCSRWSWGFSLHTEEMRGQSSCVFYQSRHCGNATPSRIRVNQAVCSFIHGAVDTPSLLKVNTVECSFRHSAIATLTLFKFNPVVCSFRHGAMATLNLFCNIYMHWLTFFRDHWLAI